MKKSTCIALLLPSLLTACAFESKRIDAPGSRMIDQHRPPSEADQLLGHIARTRKLEAREFAVEREMVRTQFQNDKSDFNRVKYALMLAMAPGATSTVSNLSVQDDVELIAVVEPLIASSGSGNTPGASSVRALAALLHGVVSDRRKVREQLRDTQSRLVLAKKEDTRDAEARALRARVEELETQLNALKLIERSVIRRAEDVRK